MSPDESEVHPAISLVPAGTLACLASDGGISTFPSAAGALAAALDLQLAGPVPSRRIAVDVGPAHVWETPDGPMYDGPVVERASRLRDAAHAGQTLVSAAAAEDLTLADLPAGSWLADIGAHRPLDLSRPEPLFELRHADLVDSPRPLSTLDRIPHNLPVQLSTFVGRGAEVEAIGALIPRTRLLTLTGSGGSGKTRLAVHVAARLAERWPDGVWWVELGSLSDPAKVADAAAAAVGVLVEPTGGPLAALSRQLRDRRTLLCLDNCEHLVDACAGLADALLRDCPELAIIATSREPLDVAGETVWTVPPLVEDEAVALFFERASRVRPWLTLDGTIDADVRAICRQLDGIPLGIELAAAWLRTLTPAQIAAGLDDRFALLVRGQRGATPRQQTLEASIAWSHDLLEPSDRIVFRSLAVFAGGFTLDAARAVAGGDDVIEALGRLVDKSLVVADERDQRDGTRFRMLETIRQFGGDRLADSGDEPSARRRHFDHMMRFVLDAETTLVHDDQDAALARLESEHDNLRAALDWSLAEGSGVDRAEIRRLAASMVWLWYLHGHGAEGHHYLGRAIELDPDERSDVHGRLLTAVAAVAVARGQFPVMADYAQQALSVATEVGDHVNAGRALMLLATAQSFVGLGAAHDLAVQARSVAEAADDPFVAAAAAVIEGLTHSIRDDHTAARPVLELGFERARARRDRFFESLALVCLNDGALRTGDVAGALALAEQARATAVPLGDYYTVGQATCHLALTRAVSGDIDGALELVDALVRSIEGADQRVFVPRLAAVVGHVLLWKGDATAALKWFERDAAGADGPVATRAHAAVLPGVVAALRRLGRREEAAARIELALEITRRIGMPHLVAEAVEQAAWLQWDESPESATALHHDALAIRLERGLRLSSLDSVEALAAAAAYAGRPEEAVRLFAAAAAARDAMGAPIPPYPEPAVSAALDDLRSGVDAVALDAAWAEGSAMSLDDAIQYLRRARGTRGRPSSGWDSLTPAELEVVRLVLEGLANPAIGSRLFMSRGTVKAHLSHVYAKLGVANRTELATVATSRIGA